MDEQALIVACRNGDLEAFNRLVEMYQTQVFNVAFRMLGSMATAEDITQDTFLSAYQHLKDYRGGSFKGWLLRITTNACYDHLRSQKRQKSGSLDFMLEEDPAFEPASTAEGPEDSALRAELSASIVTAFATLPADQRAVIILSDVEGFTYEEIALATGAGLGTVKSRLSRARAHVREYFSQHGELLPSRYRLDM